MIESVAYLSLHSCPLQQPGIGDAGGMNVYIRELGRAMAEHGTEVVVFTRRSDQLTPDVVEVAPGFQVVHIEAGPRAPLPISEMPGLVAEFAEGTLAWIDQNGTQFDILHSHYWLSGWAGVLLKEKLGLPLANSFHTLGRVKDLTRRADQEPARPIRTLTEEEVIARSDCVVASTPFEFDDLMEHYSADPARLCTSPPGINHAVFRPGSKRQARSWTGLTGDPIVLFAGRIQPLKGVDVAIEALSMVSPEHAQLVIIGGPSGSQGEAEMARLRSLTTELGLAERVHFIPPVDRSRLAAFYQAADAVIVPSRSETFGLVAAEAQSCGTPVVAAAVGGLPYIIEDGKSGLLVDGHDPVDYAAALDRVLTDDDLAATLSAGALDHSERFSWDATVSRFLELYEGISASSSTAI
ncbi:MAG: glycosyltransferase [Acidimicrobiia bacterium]|nr:glycosyltransferase [Acidimicrobiia bacterium]